MQLKRSISLTRFFGGITSRAIQNSVSFSAGYSIDNSVDSLGTSGSEAYPIKIASTKASKGKREVEGNAIPCSAAT
jgi:hypothetical protein